MMPKWLSRVLWGIAAVALILAVLIGGVIFNNWYQNTFKSVIQVLEVPNLDRQYVLMTDIAGFGDRAWYVYGLPGSAPLTKDMKSSHNEEGVLFWNYSEAGDHYDDPKIEILKNRYLVFSRGGLYHSLYDIQRETLLINDESPWNSFQESEQFKAYGDASPPEETGTGMGVWVRNNLHRRIMAIVNDAQ